MRTQKRVLIIGGSGFIGAHLCTRLLRDGYTPIIFDRVPPSTPGVEYHRGDMASIADLWPSLLEGVQTVFHLAWTTKPQSANDAPLFDLQSNVVAGVHMLEGVARLKHRPRIVFVSTGGAVYGSAADRLVAEDFPTNPINAYGLSKLTLEHYLRLYHRLHEVDYLVFRPGNPYGEGQDPRAAQGAAAVFLGKMFRDEEIVVWGDGEVVRDYFHVDDLVEALSRGMDYQPQADSPRTFNVGSGQGVSLNGLIALLEGVSGKRARVRHVQARKTDVPKIVLDISRIRLCLDWSPQVELEVGLRRTWQWICSTEGGIR